MGEETIMAADRQLLKLVANVSEEKHNPIKVTDLFNCLKIIVYHQS